MDKNSNVRSKPDSKPEHSSFDEKCGRDSATATDTSSRDVRSDGGTVAVRGHGPLGGCHRAVLDLASARPPVDRDD